MCCDLTAKQKLLNLLESDLSLFQMNLKAVPQLQASSQQPQNICLYENVVIGLLINMVW